MADKKFEDQTFIEINKFRKQPSSAAEEINKRKVAVFKFSKISPQAEKEFNNFTDNLAKMAGVPELQRDEVLDEIARENLNQYINDEDDGKFFNAKNLKDKVPDEYLKVTSFLLIDDPDEPNAVVNKLLLNQSDKEKVGRNALLNKKVKYIGLAHGLKDDEDVIALFFSENAIHEISPEEFTQSALDELEKFRKNPKIILKKLQKYRDEAAKAKTNENFARELDSFIKDVSKQSPLPSLKTDPELDKIASEELEKALYDEGYDPYQEGRMLNGIIPKNYDECILICDTCTEDPEELPARILSSKSDKNKIARTYLIDPTTTRIGFAYGKNGDIRKAIIILAKEPSEEEDEELPEGDLTDFKQAFDLYDINGRGKINTKNTVERMRETGFDQENPEIFGMMNDLAKKCDKCTYPMFVKHFTDNVSDIKTDEGLETIFNCFLENGEDTIKALNLREIISRLGPSEKAGLYDIDKFIINKNQTFAEINLDDFLNYMKTVKAVEK